MSSLQNVLLLGASGRAGSAIKDALLANKRRFSKLGVVTTPGSYEQHDKAPLWASLKEQDVEVIQLDLTDKAAMLQAFKGIIASIPGPCNFTKIPVCI
jgi:uncharacterized protein YbjT (DUF2867 family)